MALSSASKCSMENLGDIDLSGAADLEPVRVAGLSVATAFSDVLSGVLSQLSEVKKELAEVKKRHRKTVTEVLPSIFSSLRQHDEDAQLFRKRQEEKLALLEEARAQSNERLDVLATRAEQIEERRKANVSDEEQKLENVRKSVKALEASVTQLHTRADGTDQVVREFHGRHDDAARADEALLARVQDVVALVRNNHNNVVKQNESISKDMETRDAALRSLIDTVRNDTRENRQLTEQHADQSARTFEELAHLVDENEKAHEKTMCTMRKLHEAAASELRARIDDIIRKVDVHHEETRERASDVNSSFDELKQYVATVESCLDEKHETAAEARNKLSQHIRDVEVTSHEIESQLCGFQKDVAHTYLPKSALDETSELMHQRVHNLVAAELASVRRTQQQQARVCADFENRREGLFARIERVEKKVEARLGRDHLIAIHGELERMKEILARRSEELSNRVDGLRQEVKDRLADAYRRQPAIYNAAARTRSRSRSRSRQGRSEATPVHPNDYDDSCLSCGADVSTPITSARNSSSAQQSSQAAVRGTLTPRRHHRVGEPHSADRVRLPSLSSQSNPPRPMATADDEKSRFKLPSARNDN